MYCKYCGKNNSDENAYCTDCGRFLNYHPDPNLIVPTSNDDLFYLDNHPNRKIYLIAIIIYAFLFYIFPTIFQFICLPIWLATHHVTYDLLMNDENLLMQFSIDISAITNISIYILAFLIIFPLMWKVIKKDWAKFRQNQKKYWKWYGIGIAILYIGNIIGNLIITLLTIGIDGGQSDSANQEAIQMIMESNIFNMLAMSVITVLIAPIIEELIFRKVLFGFFKKNTIKTVILSAIIFASIHIVPACIDHLIGIINHTSNWIILYTEAVMIFGYLGQGFALSFTYHKSGGNIIPSIGIHMTNNLLATILMLFSIITGNSFGA